MNILLKFRETHQQRKEGNYHGACQVNMGSKIKQGKCAMEHMYKIEFSKSYTEKLHIGCYISIWISPSFIASLKMSLVNIWKDCEEYFNEDKKQKFQPKIGKRNSISSSKPFELLRCLQFNFEKIQTILSRYV